MRIDQFTFGSIRIDGMVYEHDVVIARGRVCKRRKKSSKPFRDAFGRTPLSIEEDIPWDCQRLVVGTGADGALPVMDEVKQEAARQGDQGPGTARSRCSVTSLAALKRSLKCLMSEISKTQKFLNCIGNINVTQYGDSAGSFGYSWSDPTQAQSFLTTALEFWKSSTVR